MNEKGAPLYGLEINWQQPFDFLPDLFSNFGFLANATFVQARQTYFLTADGSQFINGDLTNLSRTSANGTLTTTIRPSRRASPVRSAASTSPPSTPAA